MAREASPAFQFYPADFLADENVASMTAEERGVYITLLCICWREGSIPENPENLGMACGLNGKRIATAWQGLWQTVGKCFAPHPKEAGRLVHPRLEREREGQAKRRKSRSEAGLRGAKARWQGHSDRNATAMANDGSSSSSSSSSSNTKNPPTPHKPKANPTKINFPPELDSLLFLGVWQEWTKHRREIKKPLTQTQAEKQLWKFAQWGQARAISAIEHTIAQGWQGIREPDQDNARQTTKPNRKPTPI